MVLKKQAEMWADPRKRSYNEELRAASGQQLAKKWRPQVAFKELNAANNHVSLELDSSPGASRWEPSVSWPLDYSFAEDPVEPCENPNSIGFKNRKGIISHNKNVQILGRFQGWSVRKLNIKASKSVPTVYPQFNSHSVYKMAAEAPGFISRYRNTWRQKMGHLFLMLLLRVNLSPKRLPEETSYILLIRTTLHVHL